MTFGIITRRERPLEQGRRQANLGSCVQHPTKTHPRRASIAYCSVEARRPTTTWYVGQKKRWQHNITCTIAFLPLPTRSALKRARMTHQAGTERRSSEECAILHPRGPILPHHRRLRACATSLEELKT